jgi:hypothetical protein
MSTKIASPFFASRWGLKSGPKMTARRSRRWKRAEQTPAIRNARDRRRFARQVRMTTRLCHAFSPGART